MRAPITNRHRWFVAIIVLWMAAHVLLTKISPGSAKGPSGPPHSLLMLAFWLEALGHMIVLGAVITAIRDCIPWWKNPTYRDDGLLSIDNAAKLAGSPYEVLPIQWNGIAWVTGEFILYLLLWALILRAWFGY